jgi:hypothetical protein
MMRTVLKNSSAPLPSDKMWEHSMLMLLPFTGIRNRISAFCVQRINFKFSNYPVGVQIYILFGKRGMQGKSEIDH